MSLRSLFACTALLSSLSLATAGASAPARVAKQAHAGRPRPAFVDRTRFDRFAPNAVRRARVAFLIPAHPSAAAVAAARRAAELATSTSTYKVLNLDAIIASSGTTIQPLALNDDGRIVGSTSTFIDSDVSPGYLINNSGSNAYLAYPPYDNNFEYDFFPIAISNKSGTVAGFSDDIATVAGGTTYYYRDSEIWTLSGATSSVIDFYKETVISDTTQIADISNTDVPIGGRYYWTASGQRTPFAVANCPIANFTASAIDDGGVIVGSSNTNRAAVLTLGGCPTLVPNAVAGFVADAVAENGDMILKNGSEYDLWAKGKVSPIALPSGYSTATYAVDAIALNASDVVVGNVVTKDGSPVAAFEYAAGKTVNLQTLFPAKSGWTAMAVTGINDAGEIIGDGYYNGTLSAFALRH